MTITESSLLCNRRGSFIDSVLRQGNIIPHLWYHKILRKGGKPDTVSIIVLADLAKLYCECSGAYREFQISYSDLRSKFNYTKRQLYPAIKRLEQRGLITRAERSKEIEGKNVGNFLYLTLNIDALLALSDCDNSSGNNSNYDSNYDFKFKKTALQNSVDIIDEISSIPYIDNNNLVINNRLLVNSRLVKDGLLGKNSFVKNILAEDESAFNDKSTVNQDFNEQAKSIDLNLISKSDFSESSSSKSNLIKPETESSFFKSDLVVSASSTNANTSIEPKSNAKSDFKSDYRAKVTAGRVHTSSTSKSSRKAIKKSLAEFHPLTENDAELLRISSGREFNLNFVNQLLLKLAKAKTEHGFASKRTFISYMGKALKYELRQATVANNEGYVLRCNKDKVESSIDSYLQYVENNNATTRFERLRKKIACMFAPKTAYALLTKARFFERANEGVFSITLQDITALSEHSKEMLLNEVRATYGSHINALEFIEGKVTHSSKSNINSINNFSETLKTLTSFEQPEQLEQFNQIERFESFAQLESTQVNTTTTRNIVTGECVTDAVNVTDSINANEGRGTHNQNSLWGSLRARLRDYCGEDVDRAWFSKLKAVEHRRAATDIADSTHTTDTAHITNNSADVSELILKAPSKFQKDYIEQNYRYLMDRFCQVIGGGSLKLTLQTV